MQILLKLFPKKIKEEGILPNLFYKAYNILISKPENTSIRKESYGTILLINIYVDISNKMLANYIHQHTIILHHDKIGFILGMQGTCAYQLM